MPSFRPLLSLHFTHPRNVSSSRSPTKLRSGDLEVDAGFMSHIAGKEPKPADGWDLPQNRVGQACRDQSTPISDQPDDGSLAGCHDAPARFFLVRILLCRNPSASPETAICNEPPPLRCCCAASVSIDLSYKDLHLTCVRFLLPGASKMRQNHGFSTARP